MLKLREKKPALNLYDDNTIKWENDGKRYCVHIQRDSEPENPREQEDNIDIMACWHSRYTLGDKTGDANPEAFWRRLVRENVPYDEIYAAAKGGKLEGIRLAPNDENPKLIDIYETYYLRTVIGNSDASECLEYEALTESGVVEFILDDLTIIHCMTLMEPYAEWMPLWLYEHSGITMSCGARVYPYDDEFDAGQVGWIVALKEKITNDLCADETNWRKRALDYMKIDVEAYDQYLTGDVYGYTLYVADKKAGKSEDINWVEVDSCWGFFGSNIIESGLAENVDTGLLEAIRDDRYEIGEATLRTYSYYTF